MTTPIVQQLFLAVFWCSLAAVGYTYVGYPLLAALLARLGKPWQRGFGGREPPAVTVILAVRNEAGRIAARLREIVSHFDDCRLTGEVIVVSDGSTDDTVEQIRQVDDPRIRLHILEQRAGKAHAISVAASLATFDLLVFCDARQQWQAGALLELLANFADPQVGAVSGDLVLQSSTGTLSGVGAYWRFEKWLRQQEACWHSCVGVTGALCAVRRQLFRPLPRGTILDDVCWPLNVSLQGYRVVHDTKAQTLDRLPPKAGDEFQRKIRTLSGNFQLLFLVPQVLCPWNNPVWFPFVSHKLMRLVVPWALGGLLLACLVLEGPVFSVLLGVQLALYGLACMGLAAPVTCRLKPVSIASAFVMLNMACGLALLVWLSGGAGTAWKQVQYEPPV